MIIFITKHLSHISIRLENGKSEPVVKDICSIQYNSSISSIYYKLLFDELYCSTYSKRKKTRINKTYTIQNNQQFVP